MIFSVRCRTRAASTGFVNQNRPEDRGQVRRRDHVNRKMPDCRPGNAGYLIKPLLAKMVRSPRRGVNRVNGPRGILEGRGLGGCLMARIPAGARDLPVGEGHFPRFGQGHERVSAKSEFPPLTLNHQALNPLATPGGLNETGSVP